MAWRTIGAGLGRGSKESAVFVSHNGVDTWVAMQIAREISDCGATPPLACPANTTSGCLDTPVDD